MQKRGGSERPPWKKQDLRRAGDVRLGRGQPESAGGMVCTQAQTRQGPPSHQHEGRGWLGPLRRGDSVALRDHSSSLPVSFSPLLLLLCQDTLSPEVACVTCPTFML